MSRGGTRKARAQQDAERRTSLRKAKVATDASKKRNRKTRVRHGRGRAAVLHLSGFAAPLVLAFGLLRSGTPSEDEVEFWLKDLVGNPDASYLAEPAGLLYVGVIFVLAAAIFTLLPVRLWRRLYRSRDVVHRDRTSVDSAFTMVVITTLVWIFRIIFGYGDSIAAFAVIMSLLAVYVPIFSAVLAISMPVVPGSGRIGGILPGFLRVGFTERYLLSDEERDQLRLFSEAKEHDDAEG